MNSRAVFMLGALIARLQGQIPLKPKNEDLPKEAIAAYFQTDIGKKAQREVRFKIQYDPKRKAAIYSWMDGGKLDRRVEPFSNRVKGDIECAIAQGAWPVLFTYRFTLHKTSPQILEDFDIFSPTQDRSRFHPKLTSREFIRLPPDVRVRGWDLHPDRGGEASRRWFLGYPAAFSIMFNYNGQRNALKKRQDYIGEVQYVSWCLPTLVPCRGRGMASFVASGEDDPEFFTYWFDYLRGQLKVDYMMVYGLTLGPGLDVAKATPAEVMDQLLKDVDTARKERWFDREEDGQTIQSGLRGVKEAVSQGKGKDAKSRIDQVLGQLADMKGRAKTELFSLIECNLRFMASKL